VGGIVASLAGTVVISIAMYNYRVKGGGRRGWGHSNSNRGKAVIIYQ
jgi:hypothetical protein